jgi:hypothetical protein
MLAVGFPTDVRPVLGACRDTSRLQGCPSAHMSVYTDEEPLSLSDIPAETNPSEDAWCGKL